ncbi:MAG: BatD family protein [Saprospiraceae bacterium]|nr:BatD family protein [Saprospiraceae bacterium]
MRHSFLLTVFLAAAPALCAPVAAQQFVAETDVREVALGESVELRYVLHDAQADRFTPPNAFSGFQLLMGPTEMRSSGFRNGQTYRFQSWTYVLRPTRPGKYTLPTASVRVQGRTLRCDPVVVTVVQGRPPGAAAPASDEAVFLQAELSPAEVYEGQQAIYRVVLYTRQEVSDAAMVQAPDFGAHYHREMDRFDTRTRTLEHAGKTYAVRTLYQEALFPASSGHDTVGPAVLQLGVEQPSRFRGLTIPVPVTLQTQPLPFAVRPLPPAPPDFSGAVGRYVLEATLRNNQAPAGEAALLTVTLRGNGDPRRLRAPLLTAPAGLDIPEPEVIRQEDYENGAEWVHERTLQYVVPARTPGRYALMPQLVYFDPDSSRYVTCTAPDTLYLEVTPARAQPTATTDPDPGAPPPDRRLLWAALAALPLVAAAVWYLLRRRRKPAPGPAPEHMQADALQRKWHEAHRLLPADPPVFCNALLQALQAQAGAQLDIPLADLTKPAIRRRLAAHPDGTAAADALFQLWETCEQVAYAGLPVPGRASDLWEKAQAVRKSLQKLG